MTAAVTILFLNAGRRVELMECFRESFRKEGIAGRVVATDIQSEAPAWRLADARYLLPKSREAGFTDALADLCRQETVDLVVPLIDPDLPILAANRAVLEETGASVLISSPDAIRICRDKALTGIFLAARGFPIIPAIPVNDAAEHLPVIVKPRSGSASENVFKAETRGQLDLLVREFPEALIQPLIIGSEYTVDLFCNPANGQALAPVPRRRLKVRGGEVSVGRIERHAQLETVACQTVEAINLSGPVNIQMILTADGPRILEINPRFGGGCPLSISGGAPYIAWCLDLALGRPLRPESGAIANGLTMMRYDKSLFVQAS